MTDRDRLLALLEDWGVKPSVSHITGGDSHVELTAHYGGVTGYDGFVCSFHFDKTGKYLAVDVWE